MKTFNLNSDEWDGTRDRDGWRISAALVGQRIGGELIGATMSEVEPGNKLWPFHTHYLNEEWAIVLRGEPTLRTVEGEQVLIDSNELAAGHEYFELGALDLSLGELRALKPGHVFDLAQPLNRSAVRIVAHGNVLGKGHLVAIGDRLGVRVAEFAAGSL